MAESMVTQLNLTPRKRNYNGDPVLSQSPNTAVNTSSTNETSPTSRHASPAPSSASSLTELSSIAAPSVAPEQLGGVGQPAKKRKLTFIEREAEKAAKKREREEKAKRTAEEKARKDEEKRQKDELKRKQAEEKEEAKRIKELEKAEKQRLKDAEKQEKEAEKARIEAEKAKKERAQSRLGAFFINRPAPASTPPSTPDDVSEGISSRRSSVASLDIERPMFDTKQSQKPANPEFGKWILPFFVPEHTDLAPVNRYKLGRELDFTLEVDHFPNPKPVHKHFTRTRKRCRTFLPVKKIFEDLQINQVVSTQHNTETLDLFGHIPYKILSFREDVRPPYQGTYTRAVTPHSSRRISRNPFSRNLPDTNYDYDSEAEWEPPGEDDEDLNDEDEMSDADDNEEEMADFLDDADDHGRKRGPVSDMEPISTGLCWANQDNSNIRSELRQYQMDVIDDSTTFPIDPFKTQHWIDHLKPKPSPTKAKAEVTITAMQPPRLPLAPVVPNTLTTFVKISPPENDSIVQKQPGPAPNSSKPIKMIDAEFLPAFKQAIEGSDLTKAGLIEILKKQFPKCSKDAIKDTLGAIAVRVGKKEAEKKWQLVA